MTDSMHDPELIRLGDTLERAAERSLGSQRRRTRVRIAGIAFVALTIVATGTAVAAGLFTPKQVGRGMPAGSALFGQTNPTCTVDGDQTTFHCVLAHAPTIEAVDDYLGSKQILAIDGTIAGGCIGRDDAGLAWDCYIGKDAVKQDILVEDLLGQPMLGPSHG